MPFESFQGNVYFTNQRIIWISAVRETGVMGWLERRFFLRKELRGGFDIPITSIHRIEIDEDRFFRWMQTLFRVVTPTTVFVFWMGAGPAGSRLGQNRAAAKAARFVKEMNPSVTVEKL